MDRLTRALYAVEEAAGFDVEERGGALHLTFDDPPGTFVISPNSSARQIWISALSTSFKLDWSEAYTEFVLGPSGEPLLPLVSRLLTEQTGNAVALRLGGARRQRSRALLRALLGIAKMRRRDRRSGGFSRVLGNEWLGGGLAQLAAQIFGDLPPVVASVLDENFVGVHSRDDDARQIDSGNVALQGVGVDHRLGGGLLGELDAERAQEAEVGMIAGHGEHEIVLQPQLALRRVEQDRIRGDLAHGGVEVRGDFMVLDAIFDVGLDPVLDVGRDGRAAMHQGDARSVTPELQGGDGRGILGANHNNIRVVVGMRLAIVVRDLGQILAGHTHAVGQIVVAGGNHQLARQELGGAGERSVQCTRKAPSAPSMRITVWYWRTSRR